MTTDLKLNTPRAFFETRPIIRHALWNVASSRFHLPSVGYLRKMGFVEKRPLPICTLDMFFSIKTHGVDTAHQLAGQYVRFVPDNSVQNEDMYVGMNLDICRVCFNTLAKVYSQGFDICGHCGNTVSNPERVATCSTSSLGGPVGSGSGCRRLTTYMYKRTNHFQDHLRRVQAKQTSSVRPDIIASVENELRKEWIYVGDAAITTSKVRSLLKKLKLQKYYIYIFQITSKLSGRAPPLLTLVQEEKLLDMFQSIQDPFQRHCPADRTNMLNYSYLLRKLTQILGWYDLMDFFPLLKSRSKVYAQDMLWQKICKDVDFPFHKSIA